MKVCDVVLNSLWYDPRVMKQIKTYLSSGINVSCVGLKCNRYDENKIKQVPCKVTIASIRDIYDGKQNTIFGKVRREIYKTKAVYEAIIKDKPDIIHANDLNALIPAYFASKKLKCELVYDSHEICVENFPGANNILYKFILKCIEKFIVKRVGLMVSVSNAAADYFEKNYKIKRPLVVTNSISIHEIKERTSSNSFEVLNHGQFYAGRGYDLMAKACRLLTNYPEIRLAIRGFGVLEESIRKIVNEGGNSEHFVIYPPVNTSQLIEEAAKANVGIAITEPLCLNYKLSVSNKLFEYCAAGLPVIMSDIPEHRYLNERYEFGIILEKNEPKDLATAIIELYTNKELYLKLANNAVLFSKSVYWEKDFDMLIEYMKQIMYSQRRSH